jgi:transcriptional regulator with XRE-family HTH domain
MPNVLDVEHYPELPTLLQLIASGAPGWGRALRDLREMSGRTQQQLASVLGLNRSTISCWQGEKNRPSLDTLRQALVEMRVDARLIGQYFQGVIGPVDGLGPDTDPKTLALTLAEKLLKLTGADPDAIEDMIHETLDAPVLAAQGLKALSDPRSAALFLERGDRRRERRRRRAALPEPSPENAAFVRRRREPPEPASAPVPPPC